MNIFAIHPEERPAHSIPRIDARDENAWQEAADTIAYDHFRLATPEYMEWFRETAPDRYMPDLAILTSNTVTGDTADKIECQRIAGRIYEDFAQFVANARQFSPWGLERQMHEEVRRQA